MRVGLWDQVPARADPLCSLWAAPHGWAARHGLGCWEDRFSLGWADHHAEVAPRAWAGRPGTARLDWVALCFLLLVAHLDATAPPVVILLLVVLLPLIQVLSF